METLSELIKKFDLNKPGRILLALSRDEPLQAIVAAWGPDVVSWERPESEPSEDLNELWEWIWSGATVKEDILIEKAAIIHGKAKLNLAILMRIVFPDGTVERFSTVMLNEKIKKELPRQPRA